MIPRDHLHDRLVAALKASPIVALLGARQCGKTTIARLVTRTIHAEYFDLEDPADASRMESPSSLLGELEGTVVIDEVQRQPALFPILRVLADNPLKARRGRPRKRYLLLGSVSLELVRKVSESLAGRVSFVEMSGFTIEELGVQKLDRLWMRGGFPRSYLAPTDALSLAWRNDFIRTFLERDIPQLGISIPAAALRRFWAMVAHFHGQIWNAAEFARAIGSSEATARRYLDILTGTFVVRQLQPWHENMKKRQIKSPKIYVRDSGLLHALLALPDRRSVERHPKYGASWEGFLIEQILANPDVADSYFWGTHTGAELDLLVFARGRRIGFEFKRTDAPRMTKSLSVSLDDLRLDRAYIVYPGTKRFRIGKRVEALPARMILEW